MINYHKYKRFYTTGGEFTLNGNNYIGYVEVIDSVPCVDGTRELLEITQTFSTDTKLSEYFYDRLIGDTPSLPYTKNDVLFAGNDHLTYSLLESKLRNLFKNNTYIYSHLFIPNNNIPDPNNVSYFAAVSANTTSLSYLSGFVGSVDFGSTANFPELGNVKRCVTRRNMDLEDTFALFCITDNQFISLTANTLEANIIETSYNIETTQNKLDFGLLEDISINSNFIYITDYSNNVVLKYEVEGYFNNDLALANKRNFVEIIGGTGGVKDKTRFKGPLKVACTDDTVAIYDSGNNQIKIFDTNFNYKTRLKGIPLKVEQLVALEFNPNTSNLYAITQRDNVLKAYVYDSEFVLRDKETLEETLGSNEKVNNITFSYNDSNVWYLNTTSYVYKKLVNRLKRVTGRFQAQNLFTNNIVSYLENTWTEYDATFPRETWYQSLTTRPINNLWNYTHIPFGQAKFLWNLLDYYKDVQFIPTTYPYRFYKFIMYEDSNLTVVKGNDSQTDNSSKKTGLYNIKLNVPSLPEYNPFRGWPYQNITVFTQLYDIPIFEVPGPSFRKDFTQLTYGVWADFNKQVVDDVYINSPVHVFTSDITLQPGDISTYGWMPNVTDDIATQDNAFIEIDMTYPVPLSSIQILAGGGASRIIDTPPYIKILGSNNRSTYYTIGSAALPTAYNLNVPGVYVNADLNATEIVTVTSLTGNNTSSNVIINDSFKSIYANRSTNNWDDLILFSKGRIYLIREKSSYKRVLKNENYPNYGENSFTLSKDEYIQASTLNKELFKVLHDIFTLKNNIVGRFTGFYDKDVFTLTRKAYNYNIDFLKLTEQEFDDQFLNLISTEQYYISENEKNITQVINRVLSNIYDLQLKLLEITQIDYRSDLVPVFNNEGTLLLE